MSRFKSDNFAPDSAQSIGSGSLESNGIVSRPKSLFANASWNIGSTFWSMGVLVFLTPFLLKNLGATHYGLYLILASVSGMMGVMNLGLGEASLRFVAFHYGRNDFAGMNRVFQATLFVYSIMAFLGAAVLALGAHWIMPVFDLTATDEALAINLARWTALTFACRLVAGCFGAIPQALQRFDLFAKVTVAESIFRVAGFVTLVLLGYGIWGLVIWNLATGSFRLILDSAIAKKLAPKLRPLGIPSREALGEVFGYGVFAFLSQIVGMIWEHADRMLLGIFIGAQSVAFLAVPKDVAMRGLMVSDSAGNILMPKFSSMDDLAQTRRLFIRSTSTLLCLTIVVFAPFTVILPDFLSLWISPEFARQSAFIGQLVAASSMVRGAFQPYMALFRGMGKPQYVLGVTLLSSGTILLANVILIPQFGLAGAGYSYCLSAFWGLGAIVFAWRKCLGQKDIASLMRRLLAPLLLGSFCIIVGFVLRGFLPEQLNWFEFLIFASAITGGTCVIVLGYDKFIGGDESIIGLFIERFNRQRQAREQQAI